MNKTPDKKDNKEVNKKDLVLQIKENQKKTFNHDVKKAKVEDMYIAKNNVIIKNDKDDRMYVSVIEEMRRFIKVKKVIRVSWKNSTEAWKDLIKVVRDIYSVPSADIETIGTMFMTKGTPLKILDYEKEKILVFGTYSKDDHLYNVEFHLRKRLVRNSYFIKYIDRAKAPKTIFGFMANIEKYNYKIKVRKNKKIITQKFKEIKNKRK